MRSMSAGGGRAPRVLKVTTLAFAAALLTPLAATAGPVPDVIPDEASAAVPFQPLQTLYVEDFESGDGGFTASGTTSWQYGSPVAPPVPVAGQGPAMWGTNLTGDYGNNECGSLTSPPIDLTAFPPGAPDTDVRAARLLFRHWMTVENGYDAGLIQASSDGGATWNTVTPADGYPGAILTAAATCFGVPTGSRGYTSTAVPAQDAWTLADLDLTAYLGTSVQLRWVFASDFSVVKRGWYVDDIAVQLGAGASATVDLPDEPQQVTVPFTPVTNVYAEDFEATDGGWTADGTLAWEWGSPADPPQTQPGSLNVWGTRLLGDYLPAECSSVTSPPVALPAASAGVGETARLSMQVWRYLESGFDGAILQVDDGAGWRRLVPHAGYDRTLTSSSAAGTRACLGVTTAETVWSGPTAAPASDAWMNVTADLSSYLGKTIRLRAVFGSDGDTERRGIYLDDVLIQAGAGATVSLDPDDLCPTAPGWTVTGTNPSWCYGVPTSGPQSTEPVFATNLHGDYNASECSAIVSPEVRTQAVPGLGALTLTFEHFMDSASSDDGGVVQVSKDGGSTWTTVVPTNGYNSTLGTSARACVAPGATSQLGFSGTATGSTYVLRDAKIPNALVGDTIRVRFIFGSGTSTNDLGWYLKSVALNRGAGSVPLLP